MGDKLGASRNFIKIRCEGMKLSAPWLACSTQLRFTLGRIATPILMAFLFVATVVPVGLVMRALGNDPLRLRRDPKAASYWILRDPPGPKPEAMKHQY